MVHVLATSYTVSKDGLVYTLKLRQGVKFHDGTDFNAAAAKANFDRVTNPANKLKRYSLYSANRQDRSGRSLHRPLYAEGTLFGVHQHAGASRRE